jgi:hypothetical protein
MRLVLTMSSGIFLGTNCPKPSMLIEVMIVVCIGLLFGLCMFLVLS